MTVDLIREDWLKRGRFRSIVPYPSMTDEGLALGASTLVIRRTAAHDLPIAGRERRILALLAAAYGEPVSASAIDVLHRAAKAWAKGDKSLAAILIAHMGLPRLTADDDGCYHLFMAAGLLDDGLDPATLLKAWNIGTDALDGFEKFNENHDEQGRFASGPGGGSSSPPAEGGSKATADPDTAPKRRDKVDWKQIGAFEGGQQLTGDVPKKNGKPIDSSGVTVATGFDVGQHSVQDLKSMGLSATLIDKLTPYTEKKGDDAEDAKRKQPLAITQDEANQIDAAAKKASLDQLRTLYDQAVVPRGGTKFDALSSNKQTVIASVAFQWGPSFGTKSKNDTGKQFWRDVTGENWSDAVATLRRWADYKNGLYRGQRLKEAQILERG